MMDNNMWETDSDTYSLGSSVIDSALDPHVFRKIGALVDVSFNTKTLRSLLGAIPALDIGTRGYDIGCSIHNDLFLKKIVGFLKGCGNLTEGEKAEFRKQLETDPDCRRRAGENILLILDRVDNFDKTELLGKVFAARVRGEIGEDTFYRLATGITNASITDLKLLRISYEKIATYDMKAGKPFSDTLDDATSQALYNAGFVKADGYTEMTFLPNELGSTLIRLMKQ
jgi:hypothetical protein